uniref:Uncharacterized protein n=1 Tax=Chelonoidis abingdonii TaxID=106734 RepID=A0A8C0HFM7_CHEAB
MTDTMFGNSTDRWMCPNDRPMSLRISVGVWSWVCIFLNSGLLGPGFYLGPLSLAVTTCPCSFPLCVCCHC